jgi:hypothetical protein
VLREMVEQTFSGFVGDVEVSRRPNPFADNTIT